MAGLLATHAANCTFTRWSRSNEGTGGTRSGPCRAQYDVAMAFVVQPFVGEEKLGELLHEHAESESLDYKRVLDLRTKKDVCELSKDLGAMQIRGGYIVVGADDNGNVTGDLTDDLLPLFDESRLRAKVAKYLPDNMELLVSAHVVEGKNVVLIYVGVNPDGFAIFKIDGRYDTGCAFKEGEVFARHGTASERWSQSDIALARENIVAREKAKWFAERREERQAELESEARSASATHLSKEAPAESLSWELDDDTFRTMVIEQLRRVDRIPLTLFMNRVPNEASRLVNQDGKEAELAALLDKLICLAALFLELDEDEWFRKVIKTLIDIYNLGFDEHGFDKNVPVGRERLWLMIVERVVALGGYAVRRENWEAVRFLATRVGRGEYFRGQRRPMFHSWIRHGLTMAARSNMFGEGTLISLAQAVAQEDECLRPDLPPEDEGHLTSICQFDALAMVATINESRDLDSYYPSFARYYEHRTQPALARLLTDQDMRRVIFPDTDDNLANVFRYLDQTARSEGFRFAGWDSINNPQLQNFLEQHPATAR